MTSVGMAAADPAWPRSLPHPITRFNERYGKPLAVAELRALERRCRAGEGLLARYPTSAMHALLHEGVAVVCIVKRGRIATFLPRSAATSTGWRRRRHVAC